MPILRTLASSHLHKDQVQVKAEYLVDPDRIVTSEVTRKYRNAKTQNTKRIKRRRFFVYQWNGLQ